MVNCTWVIRALDPRILHWITSWRDPSELLSSAIAHWATLPGQVPQTFYVSHSWPILFYLLYFLDSYLVANASIFSTLKFNWMGLKVFFVGSVTHDWSYIGTEREKERKRNNDNDRSLETPKPQKMFEAKDKRCLSLVARLHNPSLKLLLYWTFFLCLR